jgi:hypothetical protein
MMRREILFVLLFFSVMSYFLFSILRTGHDVPRRRLFESNLSTALDIGVRTGDSKSGIDRRASETEISDDVNDAELDVKQRRKDIESPKRDSRSADDASAALKDSFASSPSDDETVLQVARKAALLRANARLRDVESATFDVELASTMPPSQFLVMGMHHSLLARALMLMGAYAGETEDMHLMKGRSRARRGCTNQIVSMQVTIPRSGGSAKMSSI